MTGNPGPEPRPFHRIFGLSLVDFFRESDVTVELEVDLSQKTQLLDVVIVHKGEGPIPRMPDGFEDLAAHNLITFKSHQDSLDRFALAELTGHYVNYRKQAGRSMRELPPESDFRLFAVCVRHPDNLESLGLLRPIAPGVFVLTGPAVAEVRVIVVHDLPMTPHNAMLHMFSAEQQRLLYARKHYRPRSPETSTLIHRLFRLYQEDSSVAITLEEFAKQTIDELLAELPPKKLLERLTRAERLEGLSPEERLEGLSPEERVQGLSADDLRAALDAMLRRGGTSGGSPSSN